MRTRVRLDRACLRKVTQNQLSPPSTHRLTKIRPVLSVSRRAGSDYRLNENKFRKSIVVNCRVRPSVTGTERREPPARLTFLTLFMAFAGGIFAFDTDDKGRIREASE